MPASSLLRALPPGFSPSPRFALWLARLPCFRRISRRDEEPLLCFNPWPCARAVAFTPAERRSLVVGSGIACCLRQYYASSALGAFVFRGLNRSFITSLRPAHSLPAERGFVGGLRPWDLPRRAPPELCGFDFCRFRIFTLRIHEYLQTSHNGTERCLRGVVIGRKNHYGSRSLRGTEVAALFYSLIESAKLAGVGPNTYLRAATMTALRGEPVLLPHQLA